MNSVQNAIFHINHFSPDRDLIGTMLINSYKEQHPNHRIIVVTHFPEIWLHNPDIFRVYKQGQTQYFYDEFVKEKNSKIFALDPMLETEMIKKRKRLIEAWCDLCKVKYNNSKPKIYLTHREKEISELVIKHDKPVFLFAPFQIFKKLTAKPVSWTADLPEEIAQKITNKMKSLNYEVVQIKNANQPELAGAKILNLNLRLTMATILYADKSFLNDFALQHAAFSFDKKTVASWLAYHHKNYGYDFHANYYPKINTNIKNMLEVYSPVFDVENYIENQNVDVGVAYEVEEIMNLILKN